MKSLLDLYCKTGWDHQADWGFTPMGQWISEPSWPVTKKLIKVILSARWSATELYQAKMQTSENSSRNWVGIDEVAALCVGISTLDIGTTVWSPERGRVSVFLIPYHCKEDMPIAGQIIRQSCYSMDKQQQILQSSIVMLHPGRGSHSNLALGA